MRVPLSILDLAPIARGQTAGDSFANSVALAQRAEELGYLRVWYAEHHNMASIASSATSVLIAHVGAQTRTIRLGAGGVMLPNHAPLLIAEQFGTLAAMYPGRIDLGLGRAPGSDQNTMYALRRDPRSADTFPEDVLELQGYRTPRSRPASTSARQPSKATSPASSPGSACVTACRSPSSPTSTASSGPAVRRNPRGASKGLGLGKRHAGTVCMASARSVTDRSRPSMFGAWWATITSSASVCRMKWSR